MTRSGASAFTLADAAGMIARLAPGWDPVSTCWACHPTVALKMWQIAAGAVQMVHGGRRPRMTFLGLVVEITEKLPALNTVGDVLLCDWSQYVIADQARLAVSWSPREGFHINQGAWRYLARVDGRPWWHTPTTLSDGSTTCSPFIALAPG